MPVNPIASAFSAYANRLVSGTGAPAASPQASAAQEATETAAQTQKEAQHGDPVAKRRLQQLQAKQEQQKALDTKPSEPGKGVQVDHAA